MLSFKGSIIFYHRGPPGIWEEHTNSRNQRGNRRMFGTLIKGGTEEFYRPKKNKRSKY